MENNANSQDLYWMRQALLLAKKAERQWEVPVGAVLVKGTELIAKAHNRREGLHSPLAHAELIAVQLASQKLERWRLSDCTLYVTLEPCVMCAGALVQARLGRLVFGATDPKGGGTTSLYTIPTDPRLNHKIDVTGGLLELECSMVLREFFQKKRALNKSKP